MAGSKHLEREPSLKSCPSLLDLPQSCVLQIVQFLPCKDLPSLLCSCRDLANMARDFYGERRVLDMRCFEKVTPSLCGQLIQRFSSARLEKCFFICDLDQSRSTAYDPDLLRVVIERFLDNYRFDDELVGDLHRKFAWEASTELFSADNCPRAIDVLVHCYLLETLLSSQPRLKELFLDVEFGVFEVAKSRGYRQHWYLMKPFLALQLIQKKCADLEWYMADTKCYQNTTVDQQHLQVKFLQNSPKLKFFGTVFGLDKSALELYERIRGSLLLSRAVFVLNKRDFLPEQCTTSYSRMRNLAAKMEKLQSVAITFNSRNCLRHCREFLPHLPCVQSVLLKCEFNAGFPSFDIDEGVQSGRFFEGLRSLISSTVKTLSLLDVPEEELGLLLEETEKLPSSVKDLRVQIVCSGINELSEQREEMLGRLCSCSPHLRACRLEGHLRGGGGLVFAKTFPAAKPISS